jgi:hypothetical protein
MASVLKNLPTPLLKCDEKSQKLQEIPLYKSIILSYLGYIKCFSLLLLSSYYWCMLSVCFSALDSSYAVQDLDTNTFLSASVRVAIPLVLSSTLDFLQYNNGSAVRHFCVTMVNA